MKRIIYILCFICILLSSCTREYKIDHLEHNIITYNDLPSTIKENVFGNHEKFITTFFIQLDSVSNYVYKVEKTFLPWVNKSYICDTVNAIYYDISKEIPPCILLKDKLYIPTQQAKIAQYKIDEIPFYVYDLSMYNEQYFTFTEILLLQLFLGTAVYVISAIILIVLLASIKKWKFTKALLAWLIHFIIVLPLSIGIWLYLPNFTAPMDLMFLEIINIPALIAECVVILVMGWGIKNK